jgi:hypothetical protein
MKEIVYDNNKFRSTWQQNMLNGYTEIEYYDGTKFTGLVNRGDFISGEMRFAGG